MIPWEEIDRAKVPGQESELILRKRGKEFSIRTGGTELMNSRIHGSEEALAGLALKQVRQKPNLNILVGGLGMGYTLAETLKLSQPDTRIFVAELIPEVISWNRDHIGHLAGMPLDDPRVRVDASDVAAAIKKAAWDIILLDVDNGPAGLTKRSNNRLYSDAGLKTAFKALTPGGVLAIWSAGDDPAFTRSLTRCGFKAKAVSVRATSSGKGSRHTIWIAVKPETKGKTS
jgi:spermidine synthase